MKPVAPVTNMRFTSNPLETDQSSEANSGQAIDGVVIVGVDGGNDDQAGPDAAGQACPPAKVPLAEQGRRRGARAVGTGEGRAGGIPGGKDRVHEAGQIAQGLDGGRVTGGNRRLPRSVNRQ